MLTAVSIKLQPSLTGMKGQTQRDCSARREVSPSSVHYGLLCSHTGGSRDVLTSSSLWQVLFKLLLGSAKFGEAALFLSILGVFNVLFITCIPIILYFTRVEYWNSFDDIPWGNLCGFSILLLSKWHPPWAGVSANSNRHRTL